MQTSKDNQIYTHRVTLVLETFITQSEKRGSTGELSGEVLEIESLFKKMLGMAGFLSDRVSKIVLKDLQPSLNIYLKPVLDEFDCDYSFDEDDVKQETVDADYDIDNIFNDLNAIFDASFFDRIDQQETDPLDSTFVIQQDSDIEKLFIEENTAEMVNMSEYELLRDNQSYEPTTAQTKTYRDINSPRRKFRLQSSVKQTKLKQIHCDECSFKTNNIRCLHMHNRKEHNDLEFFCPFCEYTTEKKRSIRSHVNRQHPAKNCKFAN